MRGNEENEFQINPQGLLLSSSQLDHKIKDVYLLQVQVKYPVLCIVLKLLYWMKWIWFKFKNYFSVASTSELHISNWWTEVRGFQSAIHLIPASYLFGERIMHLEIHTDLFLNLPILNLSLYGQLFASEQKNYPYFSQPRVDSCWNVLSLLLLQFLPCNPLSHSHLSMAMIKNPVSTHCAATHNELLLEQEVQGCASLNDLWHFSAPRITTIRRGEKIYCQIKEMPVVK